VSAVSRAPLRLAAVAAVLALLAAGGFAVVHARAAGAGAPPAPLATAPSPSASAPAAAAVPTWQVAKAVRPVVAYRRPSTAAPVRQRFGVTDAAGYPNVFLVRAVRQVDGVTWYDVWLPIRPNESHGWIEEGGVSLYATTAKIVVHLATRRLVVYRNGERLGSFPVAVGTPALPTPEGIFYVDQKLRPTTPGGPYGVLALGLSAYQPRLPNWPLGGPVAIHGTNEDGLIGQAVSHGCVRMHNADVLKVSAWVPTGSPVVIEQ
jgi:lipoprotein-anchoring transpeptidase ErfK/SrfK